MFHSSIRNLARVTNPNGFVFISKEDAYDATFDIVLSLFSLRTKSHRG